MRKAHAGRARTVVTLVLFVLMASASSACDAHRICTMGGCPRQIDFVVDDLDIEQGEIYFVEVCLDHECHTADVEAKDRWGSQDEERNGGPSTAYVPITSTGGVWVHPDRDSFTLYLEPEIHAGVFFNEHVPEASLDVFIVGPGGTVIADVEGFPVQLSMWEGNGPGCGLCIIPSEELAERGIVIPAAGPAASDDLGS